MIKSKPWSGGPDEEYETRHFGFGSQRFQISVRQMIERTITTVVRNMESDLQQSLELNDTDVATLKSSCDKLIRLYCKRAGPSMNIIDKEIETLLKIPPNVVLPEDEVQLESMSDEDYNNLKDEVANLRKSVQRGALMEALLTGEQEELSSLKEVCETAKKDMEVIDLLRKEFQESDDLKTIKNDTQFLCASVPFMNKDCNIENFEKVLIGKK